ncbi:MAG: T9SS type A sorting domain-containing protein [Bacteroidales bacterium]|nr:T9SS type A sorting domain-containing protein [Bacteroidales bacterium]
MKKTILFSLAICLYLSCFAQTLKTIEWEDTTRQYLEYVPDTYDASTPTPVVFIFHGLGGNMYEVLYNADFNRIAAEQGWITITPQALPDTFTAMDTTLTMNAWHSGVSAVVDGDTIVASEGRDDTGLMMAILDSLIDHYNIDQSNVFCTGVSMGGFMSHRMAIEHGDRIKAIAPVCGTIGNEITSYTPVGHVSVMHLHGTADSIVTYDSGSFQYIVNVNVGLGVDSTIAFWRRYNQCSDTAVHTIFPDICDDGRLFEKFYYGDGAFGTKTVLIKVNGGEHEWCHGPYRDVDFSDEIYNFFASCLGNVPTVATTSTSIASTSATFVGEVTAEGSAAVTARGVCWSSTPHPTIANLHTTDSLGIGTFTSTLTDLTPNTTYYARTYATNEVGTAYSDEICFTTLCNYSALNDTVQLTICEHDLPYHYVNDDIDTIFEVGTPNLSVFNFHFSTQYGCDSVVTLHLTVTTINTSVESAWLLKETAEEIVYLYAAQDDAEYQWIDCETNETIEGEVHQRFNIAVSGQYACIITLGECTDTTDCIDVTISGIADHADGFLSLYPNPTNDIVTLKLTPEPCALNPEIQVLDIYGQRLQIMPVRGERTHIDLSHYATGVYLIKLVTNDNVTAVRKVVKQ